MPGVPPEARLAELALVWILILDMALELSVAHGLKQEAYSEERKPDIIAPDEGLFASIGSCESLET